MSEGFVNAVGKPFPTGSTATTKVDGGASTSTNIIGTFTLGKRYYVSVTARAGGGMGFTSSAIGYIDANGAITALASYTWSSALTLSVSGTNIRGTIACDSGYSNSYWVSIIPLDE